MTNEQLVAYLRARLGGDTSGVKDIMLRESGLDYKRRPGSTHARLSGITDGPPTPEDARRLYLAGEIDVERFEDMLGEALGLTL